MTTRTICRGRLHSLVMALEAGRVPGRHRLEERGNRREVLRGGRDESFLTPRQAILELRQRFCRLMADRAVIENRRIVGRSPETGVHKMRGRHRNVFGLGGDNILVDTMRKDRRKLVRTSADGKREQRSAPRPRTRMASGTECRLVADKEIARVAFGARRVTRKLSRVRITARRYPIRRRDLVTGSAVDLLMCGARV